MKLAGADKPAANAKPLVSHRVSDSPPTPEPTAALEAAPADASTMHVGDLPAEPSAGAATVPNGDHAATRAAADSSPEADAVAGEGATQSAAAAAAPGAAMGLAAAQQAPTATPAAADAKASGPFGAVASPTPVDMASLKQGSSGALDGLRNGTPSSMMSFGTMTSSSAPGRCLLTPEFYVHKCNPCLCSTLHWAPLHDCCSAPAAALCREAKPPPRQVAACCGRTTCTCLER